MYLNKIEIIDEDLKTFPAMSNAHDMAIQTWLCDHVAATTICELGAGNGHWSVIMSRNLNKRDTDFILVDDFRDSVLYADLNYPRNVSELQHAISQFGDRFECISGNAGNLPESKTLIDVVRLDCDIPGNKYEKFADWLLRNTSDNLVIFVDDVKPNIRPDRMFMMHELVRLGKLEFLWGGYEEAAWCKPNTIDRDKLHKAISELYAHYFDYIHLAYHENLFGICMNYLTTRPKWITDGPRV